MVCKGQFKKYVRSEGGGVGCLKKRMKGYVGGEGVSQETYVRSANF